MEDLAARLCDLLPAVPLRQWTVSFPFALRRLLAADADLLSAVHRSFVRIVFETLRASAPVPGRTAAISFLQRVDASLGIDPHIHLACIDGVYAERPDGTLEFHDAGPPSSAHASSMSMASMFMPTCASRPSTTRAATASSATPQGGCSASLRGALRPPFAYDQITLTSDGRIAPFGYCFAAPGGTL